MMSRYVFSLLVAFVLFPLLSWGQSGSCVYTLEVEDVTGQGWNSAALELQWQQVINRYSLEEGKTRQRFFFRGSAGDTLSMRFVSGQTDAAVAFRLYDVQGSVLYQSAGTPVAGEVTRLVLACPSCAPVAALGVQLVDIRAYTAQVSWIAAQTYGSYLLEYGVSGFLPGTGTRLQTAATSAKISNLKQHTSYDLYLSQLCANGDTSKLTAPIVFRTLWANDVGVSAVLSPESGCELGSDSVIVGIHNYGGEPQSLIPFLYAVNGKKASISMPKDGLFTGVIGKDSTEEASFDALYDFSKPGEYLVEAWTELTSDSLVANDSVAVLVTSAPTIATYPYFTNLDAGFTGWYIDTKNSQSPSWELGTPSGSVLSGAFSGTRAWTTRLAGAYPAAEWSYLLSPCLDFTSLQRDPMLSFALRVDAEACCDGAWVEMSMDAGATWSVLGQSTSGINWYNEAKRQVWTSNGGAPGWFVAAHPLTGTAGLPDVRLRLVFRSDYARNLEGIAVDNIRIAVADRDVAAMQVRNNGSLTCGAANDQVVLTVGNLGQAPVSNLQLAYQVNGGTITKESLGSQLLNAGQKLDFSFNTRFSSAIPGTYTIKAWVVTTDAVPSNDTIFYTFSSARSIPFVEDFERGVLPRDWSTDTDLVISNTRGNRSYALSDNLFTGDRQMRATTPSFGPVASNDSLTFEYRFADLSGAVGAALGTADKLEVFISTDCGITYRPVAAITAQNHIVSAAMRKFSVRLDSFVNKYIQVRFQATWGQGDYYVDIDNIRVLRCPESLSLTIDVAQTGAAPVATVLSQSLTGPYTYLWNTGETTASIRLPTKGTYEVTVTNRDGCQDRASTVVTDLHNILAVERFSLAPNPSSGISQLQVQFPESTEVVVQVLSLYGQVLQQTRFSRTTQLALDIPLVNQPAGIYLVRVLANGKSRTEKLTLIHP